LVSSLFSLIIGSVLGLTQFRIKRLFAYSTISHVGFILLALSINSVESIQAYLFYILSYTISNLNAFVILVTIGYSFYKHAYNKNNTDKSLTGLSDENNSPIQLVSQMKGYFYVNPFLALSLTITLFSFAGVPPLIGFFAKQMVLSSALDNGYIFISLVAILTSVISAVYYLNIIKEMFFFNNAYFIPRSLQNIQLKGIINNNNIVEINSVSPKQEENNDISLNSYTVLFNTNNIILNSALTISISIMSLTILLFIFTATE